MLVLDTETGEKADPEPKSGGAAVDDSNKQIDTTHPKKRFERVHGKEIAVDDVDRGGERSGAAQTDRPASTAQSARDQTSENDGAGTREGREQPDSMERITEERPAQPDQQDRQRRLINVAQSQVLAARYIIELIPKVAVAAVGEEVEEQGCCSQADDQVPLGCGWSRRGLGTRGLHFAECRGGRAGCKQAGTVLRTVMNCRAFL